MKVYTVTVIDLVGDITLGNRRTPGIFTSLDKAITAVQNNENNLNDDNLYQYAVIEETSLDVIRPDTVFSTRKWWFKFNTVNKEFECCELSLVPRNISRLSGFGIG